MFDNQFGMLHKLYPAIIPAIVVVIIITAIGIAYKSIKEGERKRNKEYVAQNSRYIGAIIELSKDYGINFLLKEKYTRQFTVNTKYAVDNFNFKAKILEDIEKNEELYNKLFNDFANNSDCWEDFVEEVNEMERIKPSETMLASGKISEKAFTECEDDFINKLLSDRPVQNPVIEYYVEYTSPKGRNTYWDTRSIHADDLPVFFGALEELKKYKESAQYQRRLITPKRRLQIIAKDGGRCCLCGRSARDGVQLDVDHFIPVSKGGKSTDDNLWTLCHECNLGKSNYTIEELQEVFDQAMAERK